MTDLERILTFVSREVLVALFIDNLQSEVEVGDIVMPHNGIYCEWNIGRVVQKGEFYVNPWIICDLITGQLYNIIDDHFLKMPFEIPNYILLRGIRRKIYKKCIKVLKSAENALSYRDISFADNICTLKFSYHISNSRVINEEIKFEYSSKTKTKSIKKLINSVLVPLR